MVGTRVVLSDLDVYFLFILRWISKTYIVIFRCTNKCILQQIIEYFYTNVMPKKTTNFILQLSSQDDFDIHHHWNYINDHFK
jgi:hypothetical protein